jgi:hypothetical protein
VISIKPALANASFSIRDNLDPDSNVTEDSDPQSEKQLAPNTSIDEGNTISTNRLRKNANFSIRDNFNPDLNVTEEK